MLASVMGDTLRAEGGWARGVVVVAVRLGVPAAGVGRVRFARRGMVTFARWIGSEKCLILKDVGV